MSTIAEVRFVHEEGALVETFAALPAVDVTVFRETSTEPSQRTYFLTFEDYAPNALVSALEEDRTVRAISRVSMSDRAGILGVEFTERANLLDPIVTDHDGFVLHARRARTEGARTGWRERWLLPETETLYSIWDRARREGFTLEILRFESFDGRPSEQTTVRSLTDEQRTALALAHERGYFSEPRETRLDELAAELDRSPSAVAGRLKRGMRILIEESLVVNEPD